MKYPIITIILGTILLCPKVTICQCSNSGVKNGSSFTNDNSGGSIAFSSPSNSLLPDGIFSSASATVSLFSANTQYLKATGFGFTIPNSSTICGIKVEVDKKATGINILTSIKDNAVRLVKAGAAVGSNYAKSASWSTSQSYFTYGGVTDLWGTTWTRTEINAANFGIAFSAEINGLIAVLPSAQIDHIRMTVYFNTILPIGITDFTAAAGTGHNADLEWDFAGDGSASLLNIQRKSGNEDWKTIRTYQADGIAKERSFNYTDIECTDQEAWYRVELISQDGSRSWSSIIKVNWGPGKFSIYPNPASNELFINQGLRSNVVYCTGTDGSTWRLPILLQGNEKTRLDIRQLPRGTYVFNTDGKRGIFIKK